MKGVFLDRKTFPETISTKPIASLLSDYREYDVTTAQQTIERIGEADLVITNKVVIDKPVIEACSSLKLICVTATGLNNIDLVACKAAAIEVRNVENYGASTVAQHTMALMLMLATNAHHYRDDVSRGKWTNSDIFCLNHYPIMELSGKTLGIVGVGGIANKVIEAARGLGMKVLLSERKGAQHVRPGRVAFSDMLETSDVVSLHCPLTESTSGLISKKELQLMKSHALLINCGRGGLVDELDLVQALVSKEIGGAGFDVASVEPIEANNPLMIASLPNLIITPHSAWASTEAMNRIIAMVAEHIAVFQTS
ncbi:D-2-hydroxyacid dehydrogenase [Paraferrimonas haliotis]|uniref:D-2-hydroxyacid dehydrogenase n=1 Tax=Paraferrimonas haliotis TaxID=2013866 RepID=UPI000BA99AFB|nr:D-2-hydroxyacid dehydrogenase [Paraferrimonas haliotis]